MSFEFLQRIVPALSSATAQSALGATALISLVPNVLLFTFPAFFGSSGHNSVWWQWGQSLAAGGLLGDVFLHTLPHALQGHDNGDATHHMPQREDHRHHQDYHHEYDQHGHDHHPHDHHHDNETGLWILAGFFIFFLVDVLLRLTEDLISAAQQQQQQQSNHNEAQHAGSHSHAHQASSHNHDKSLGPNGTLDKAPPTTTTLTTTSQSIEKASWSLLVLNVTADALHNFTDGLAIGASYAAAAAATTTTTSSGNASSHSLFHPGNVATLSILLHEIPHELGDYCTLVAAGYTPWQAVRTQFVTAVAAFLGTAVALLVADSTSTTTTTSAGLDATPSPPFLVLGTAGGFLYLAGTTLLPHVLQQSLVHKPWHRLGHVVAFLIGVAFLYAVAFLEDHEDFHQHHHIHDEQHIHDHDHHHHEL